MLTMMTYNKMGRVKQKVAGQYCQATGCVKQQPLRFRAQRTDGEKLIMGRLRGQVMKDLS